jgi:hypothetical protein
MAIKVARHASGQIYRVYESTTGETVQPLAPVVWYDDFLGDAIDARWATVDVGNATQALLADQSSGICRLALTSTDEAQDAVLYFGNEKPFDVGNKLQFEARVAITSASMTGIRLVVGMAGDHNLAKDSVTEAAWFSMDGSLVLDCESDDTTNDTNGASSTTWTTGNFGILRIDFGTIADVKFYLDGSRIVSGTTFDMSNLTAGEQQMQPYLSLDKASGATLCTLDIDYVRVFSTR